MYAHVYIEEKTFKLCFNRKVPPTSSLSFQQCHFFLPNLGDLGMIINLACEIWIPGSAAFVRGAFRMPLLSYH